MAHARGSVSALRRVFAFSRRGTGWAGKDLRCGSTRAQFPGHRLKTVCSSFVFFNTCSQKSEILGAFHTSSPVRAGQAGWGELVDTAETKIGGGDVLIVVDMQHLGMDFDEQHQPDEHSRSPHSSTRPIGPRPGLTKE